MSIHSTLSKDYVVEMNVSSATMTMCKLTSVFAICIHEDSLPRFSANVFFFFFSENFGICSFAAVLFHKGDNFWDFLLVFLDISPYQKGVYSEREEFKFFPFRVDSFSERGQNLF